MRMFEFDLHFLISSFSYLGIFVLLILNGVFNVPSSQIIYLIAGYFASTGKLIFIPIIIAGTLGNTIGNFIVYKLVYKYGKNIVKKFLFVSDEALDKMHEEFSHKGIWWLFAGKLIPSIKVFVPTITGLAKVRSDLAFLVFFFGSFVWSLIVTYIGYKFGEHITLKGYAMVMSVVGIIIVFLAYKKFIKSKNKS